MLCQSSETRGSLLGAQTPLTFRKDQWNWQVKFACMATPQTSGYIRGLHVSLNKLCPLQLMQCLLKAAVSSHLSLLNSTTQSADSPHLEIQISVERSTGCFDGNLWELISSVRANFSKRADMEDYVYGNMHSICVLLGLFYVSLRWSQSLSSAFESDSYWHRCWWGSVWGQCRNGSHACPGDQEHWA